MRGIINYGTMQPLKPEKLFSIEMQNNLVTSMYLTAAKDSVYTRALKKIDTLITLINNELKK